jgi:hypothetical protein
MSLALNLAHGRLRFTGVIEPGECRLEDFGAVGPELRGPPRIPGVGMSETVYIHIPTYEIWSSAMVDAVFPPVPADAPATLNIIAHVKSRMTFKHRRGCHDRRLRRHLRHDRQRVHYTHRVRRQAQDQRSRLD